jgi:hypothetical protein
MATPIAGNRTLAAVDTGAQKEIVTAVISKGIQRLSMSLLLTGTARESKVKQLVSSKPQTDAVDIKRKRGTERSEH